MNRKTIIKILLVALLFLLGCTNQKEGDKTNKELNKKNLLKNIKLLKNDLTLRGWKGKIKSVNRYKCNSLGTNCIKIHTEHFDSGGYLRKKVLYDGDEKISQTQVYKRYPDGREKEFIVYNNNGKIIQKYISVYNSHNLLVERKTYDDDSLSNWAVYNYDSIGNCIESIFYHTNRKTYRKHIFFYENNNLIKEEVYNGDGGPWEEKHGPKLWLTHIYKYNTNGQQIEFKTLYDESLLNRKEVYIRDNVGNIIEKKFIQSGKVKGKTTFERDSAGLIIEERKLNSEGDIYQKTTFQYDNKYNSILMHISGRTHCEDTRDKTIIHKKKIEYH